MTLYNEVIRKIDNRIELLSDNFYSNLDELTKLTAIRNSLINQREIEQCMAIRDRSEKAIRDIHSQVKDDKIALSVVSIAYALLSNSSSQDAVQGIETKVNNDALLKTIDELKERIGVMNGRLSR